MTVERRGIDIMSPNPDSELIFFASLKDSTGAKVTGGTTELRLYRIEGDLSCEVYDWTSNGWVATGSGTPDDETVMTHVQRRDSLGSDVDTGVWVAKLATLAQLEVGRVYIIQVTNAGASPESQERMWQYSGFEGRNDDIHNLLEADWYVDQAPTPWQMVLVQKGTGALGVGTELLRQDLKDKDGNDVTDIGTFLGQRISP